MKKLVAMILMLAVSINGMAAQSLVLENQDSCEEGYKWLYWDTDKNGLTKREIAGQDFFVKNEQVLHFQGNMCKEGRGVVVIETVDEFNKRMGYKGHIKTREEKKSEAWAIFWGVTAIVVLAAAVRATSSGGSSDHPCDYSYQTASDGSRCGGRAASVRAGGR